MTTPADLARENAFHFEAKKTGFGQAQDGWSITFRVQHDDLPSKVKDARKGTRYMVALVEIGDDELPVKKEEEKTCPDCRTKYPLDLGECPECSTPAREDVSDVSNVADVTATAASDLSEVPARRNFTLSQKAYLLCEKPAFRLFLIEKYRMRPDESPATWLRRKCCVNSRANILPGTEAATIFYAIDSEFTAWERVAA